MDRSIQLSAFQQLRQRRQLVLLLLLLLSFTTSAAAQDWPRFRSDNGLLSRTQLRQPALATPGNFQSFQLGGGAVQPITADLDGDGKPEIIFLRDGRLVATRSDGSQIFDNFFAATELVTVTDLDNDNSNAEIIAINSFKRILLVVNADGSLRWQYQFPEFVTLSSSYIKVADITPAQTGKEVICFPDHTKTQLDAHGYFFTSTGTLYNMPLVANLNGGQLNFPEIAIGDLAGNGSLQVVVQGRPRLMIFNGDGQLLQQFDYREGDPEGRHYGLLTLADVTGDHKLSAVIVADDIPALSNNNKSMAISVLQLTPTIKRLWGTSFPQQLIHAPVNSVVDLDGDGRSEVVVNLYTGSEQQVRIYRGDGDPKNPGQPLLLTTIPGTFVWDIRDLDLDGRPDLLTSVETAAQPSLSLNSQLKIFRLAAQSGNTFVYLDAVKPVTGMYVMRSANLASAEFNQIGSSDSSRMQNLFLHSLPARFLIYANDPTTNKTNIQERLLHISPQKFRIDLDLNVARPGPIRAILNQTSGSEQFLINQESDGLLTDQLATYTRRKKKLLLDGNSPILISSSFSTEVRVGDLDDDTTNEIIVRAASGRILILQYSSELNGPIQVGSFAGNTMPIIQAIDGSKGRPALITTTSDNGRLRLVVYQTEGSATTGNIKVSELWGNTFADIPANTDVEITTGHFGGLPNRVDIFLATPRGRSMVFSGSDGTMLWQRNDVYTFGNHATVRDFNHDGKDDIYIVSDNLYRVVNGGTGTDLVGPIDVSKFGGDFYSTPILSGQNEVLLVGPATVVKIIDSGKLLWNFAKTIDGKPAQRQNSGLLMGLAELGNGGSFDLIAGNYGENDALYVYDYGTGLLSYKTTYQPITEIVSVDLDGDGQDEFIFGTVDGQIVALHAKDGSLLWSVPVDSLPKDPIIAGIGKEKRPALIFSPGDGTLRIYPIGPASQ